VGWTPDDKRVLFQSTRNSASRYARLFTIPVEGGFPDELPLPMAHHGSYSPDGSRLAYVPFKLGDVQAWKRYHGGTQSFLWLADLSDSSIVKVAHKDSNDFNPLWVGDRVYFISDRGGANTLFCYDTRSKEIRQVFENNGQDLKSASAGPGAIVYEQFGSIHLFDTKTEKSRRVDIRVNADMPLQRPRFVKAAKYIQNATLSPTGMRAAFEARGEILTAPAKKGDVRNLTNTPGVAERDPSWSPDGRWIAYFSDESGEYELHLSPQSGLGKVKKFALGNSPAFPYAPRWSPDGKRIAFTDNFLHLRYITLDTGAITDVDTNTFMQRTLDPAWSPDSRWLAYTKVLKNHLNAAFVHSLEDGKSRQITDGTSDVRSLAFDKNGKYLYFTASTDAGPAMGGIEMSNFNYPVTRSAYVAVLDKTLPSPLAPESDEEKAADAGKKEDKSDKKKEERKDKVTPAVKIDFENLDQRILALPVPARNYAGIVAGKSGVLFLAEIPQSPAGAQAGPPGLILHKFELDKRKVEPFLQGISNAVLSHDGEKILYRQKDKWFLAGTAAAPKPGEGTLALEGVEVRVDPKAEWKQMYEESWRIERDFLYDPGFHGYNLKAARKEYLPYLENVASRRDLNYLFVQMLSELSLGHVYVFGGDMTEPAKVKGGLLGCDFAVDKGRYRFARIHQGENWSPQLRAPLTGPGVNVKQGEYLLAVNGQEVRAPENVYRFFEGTAGKAVVLRVGPDSDGKDARDVTVVPIDDEYALRNRAWMEDNRRKVTEMTKGRVAYVYLPDTALGGYSNFNRYFFAQTDKDAAIIDERFNGGGKAADYIVERLGRPLANYWSSRVGEDYTTPANAIFGPKVMIVNEMAGSGGDYLPWAFRRAKLGPIVGKRTWGGLVGIGGYPPLIDGGAVTAPHFAFWTPEGEWEVENRGVAPDIEVEMDPKAWRAGHDPQLEKAVQLTMEALEKYPAKRPQRPAYPNYHKGKMLVPTEQGGQRQQSVRPQERPRLESREVDRKK
jgi:tricorn protease